MTADAQLAWQADGLSSAAAPTIILLHSLGADRHMWSPQVRALAGAYHVVQIDLPGHGIAPRAVPSTLEGIARTILAAADAAGATRFHIVGISLGGMVALQV